MASTAAKYLTLLRRGGYLSTILSTGPVALWPLSETSGTTAVDVVGGLNGTYNGITVNNATFGDGTGAPLFDSVNDFVALTGLAAIFNTNEGSVSLWAKVAAASVWTDSTQGQLIVIGTDANNRVFIAEHDINHSLYSSHRAGGTVRSSAHGTSTVAWFHVVLTWSASGASVYQYLNGTQSSNAGAPGTWAGSIVDAFCAIGRYNAVIAAQRFNGWIKYAALWNRALTPAEITTLYVSGFAV